MSEHAPALREHLAEGLPARQPGEVWFMGPLDHRPNRVVEIAQRGQIEGGTWQMAVQHRRLRRALAVVELQAPRIDRHCAERRA